MRQAEIERAVAGVTGESRRTIAQYGFHEESEIYGNQPMAEIGMNCPGCGHCVLIDSDQLQNNHSEAECLVCDLFYPFEVDELQVF